MSKRQLTQQEIDDYFEAAARGAKPPAENAGVAFDFRRLYRISKSQLGAVHVLHERFVRTVVSSLSAYLRSYISGNLICVEQTTYTEFAESLPSPTCMAYVSMKPYDGYAVLEINQCLIGPLLELMLGGVCKSKAELKREITELEESILDGLFRLIVRDLTESWQPVGPIEFVVDRVETKPQLSRRFDRTDAVVAIAIELRLGEVVGMVNLALPSVMLKMMRHRFDQQRVANASKGQGVDQAIRQKLERELMMTLHCQLSGNPIGLQDLLNMQPGQVMDIGRRVDQKLTLAVAGMPAFEGRLCSNGSTMKFVVE